MRIRKQTIFIVAGFIVVALASILLMPGRQEFALMQMRDMRFEEAVKIYESQAAQNKLTFEVAQHLSDLYTKTGHVNKAADIMQTYVAKNPDHLDARKILSTYLMYANRQDEYQKNLEAMTQIGEDVGALSQLSQIYNARGEYAKQTATLRELIEAEHGKNPQHYIDLANVIASTEKYKEAMSVLKELQTLHPEHYGFNEALLFISFLLKDHQKQEALREANAWIYAYRKLDDAAKIASVLHYRGDPEVTLEFLGQFSDKEMNESDSLLEQLILAQIANGEQEKAYVRLKILADQKSLPPTLTKNFLFSAMASGDKRMVQTLISGIDLSVYKEDELIALVEQAQNRKDPTYLDMLKVRFSDHRYEQSHPLLFVALSVVTDTLNTGADFSKLRNIPLAGGQALAIARMCYNVGRHVCTRYFLDRIVNADGFAIPQIVDVGTLYANIGALEPGKEFLDEATQKQQDPKLEKLSAIYLAAMGEDAGLERWISQHMDWVDHALLSDLLFTANKHQKHAISVLLAEMMQERYDSSAARSLLANAYMATGQHDAAISLLRRHVETSDEDRQNYLAILTTLMTNDHRYREEFRAYTLNKLEKTTDEKERLALIYALLNAKETDAALPYIAKLAEDQGGEWAALYATSLDKTGKHAEAKAFWLKVAHHPASTQEQRRSIAFTLLNQGYRVEAEQLFLLLAVNAAPDSDDVNLLLNLWGPHLNDTQMAWLIKRSKHANDTAQSQWLDIVANYAGDHAILSLAASDPHVLRYKKITERYVSALIHQRRFADAAAQIIAQEQDTELLHIYAATARQNQFSEIARSAYETILSLKVDDVLALRELGMLAFEEGRYADADAHLRHYFSVLQEDDKDRFRAEFYYAETLRYYEKHTLAKQYYSQVINSIKQHKIEGADSMTIAAVSLMRLGNTKEAIALFEEARARYPDNSMLRADYASALMDVEQYENAAPLLALPASKASHEAPIILATHNTKNALKSQQLLEDDSKLVLEYAGKLEKEDIDRLRAAANAPWVSYVSEGYGEAVVVAKPGYRMFVRSEPQSLIIDAKMDESSREAMSAKQVPLRLHLLAARKALDTGNVYDANASVKQLMNEHPQDVQVLSMAASAANAAGNWPKAQKLVALAQEIVPEHEGMKKLAQTLTRENGPHAVLDMERLSSGDNSQWIKTLSGLAKYADNIYAGAFIKDNQVSVRSVRRADGRIGNYRDDKQQMELFVQRFTDENERYKFSLFANNDTSGFGGYYSILNPYGDTTLSAEWQKPYWEGFDAILDDATRNRLGITHAFKPDRRWYVSGTSALNQYDNTVDKGVLETVAAKLEILYTLYDAEPYVALGYGFDGEYDLGHTKAFDNLGTYTRLFSQGSREVHFFSVNVAERWNETLSGDIFAGYAYDRFGSMSPTISGKLTYALREDIDVQLRALYGLDKSNSSSSTTRIGINLRWRYQGDAEY